eukprot:TRINITY_DN3896_c0_g1_i14.p1 TRINITY_DN3896_c0_g1~~TRINITY_DN3896_c0_g1_i14.p1  ORF type:complete len:1346 (+),score=355.54 TRINITY_DN3896_c0_g1_i14:1414-5451(+)
MGKSEQQPLLSPVRLSSPSVNKPKPLKDRHFLYVLRAECKWLLYLISVQVIGNLLRALPIFVLEKYFVMLLIFFQFLFLASGYYGIHRLSAPLILVYILGNILCSLADMIMAATYTRQSLSPGNSEITFWTYFALVAGLCAINLFSALFPSLRLLTKVIHIRAMADYQDILLTASLFGAIGDNEEKETGQPSRLVYVDRSTIHAAMGGASLKHIPTKSCWPFKKDAATLQITYLSNKTRTSKYNVLSFVPKMLYYQFSRLANLYTLCIVFLCLFSFSPVSPASSITPLAVVIGVAAVKELLEDIKRHKADRTVNMRPAHVLRSHNVESYQSGVKTHTGDFEDIPWLKVQVGDILLVKDRELLPADLLMLGTSREDGRSYLETSNLDGETNLKARSTHPKLMHIKTKDQLAAVACQLECEAPNNRIYDFEGTLNIKIGNDPVMALSISADSMLLRGTVLRNTEWVYGLVVYAGHDTKVEKNAMRAPQKRSNVEKGVNTQLMWLFLMQTIICIVCSIGHGAWQRGHLSGSNNSWYLKPQEAHDFVYMSYVILYNTLIPLSMYVSMELIRMVNASFINNDLGMYDETGDTPAIARNTNINEELGQIQYVFSDKTGTLTCNEMIFSKCSVGGHVIDGIQQMTSSVLRDKASHPALHDFMLLLAICNTVVLEAPKAEDAPGTLSFQAQSPDEEALVRAAYSAGYCLGARAGNRVRMEALGVSHEYEVLNVLEFNSYRKRMSLICREVLHDGTYGPVTLYIKGADSVIFQRLARGQHHGALMQTTAQHLDGFANEGLRTLCMAMRVIEPEEYDRWSTLFTDATLSLSNRADKVEAAMEEIERDLVLLGGTGIEDRLQPQVPETLQALRQADLNVWMMTGDKLETAVSIAKSCGMMGTVLPGEPGPEIVTLSSTNKEELVNTLEDIMGRYQLLSNISLSWIARIKQLLTFRVPAGVYVLTRRMRATSAADDPEAAARARASIATVLQPSESSSHGLVLVVDGPALAVVLEHDVRFTFLQVAKACKTVVCCRCSPLQKAKVVGLVSERSFLWGDGAITLAIGDGANDVPMIQGAHVGVGISGGKEGRQAVLSSDYAIGRFHFLQRLLFIHGSRSFSRISILIMYSFCKNTALAVAQFWFGFVSGFSGQTMYFDFLFTLYNSLFTSFPILAVAILDRHHTEDSLLAYPWLYRKCARGKAQFCLSTFMLWVAMGVWQSMVIFTVPFLALETPIADGTDLGMWCQGTTTYCCLILTTTIHICLFTRRFTTPNIVAVLGSLFLFIGFIALYCITFFVDSSAYGVIYELLSVPVFWLCLVLVPVMALMPEIIFGALELFDVTRTTRLWGRIPISEKTK